MRRNTIFAEPALLSSTEALPCPFCGIQPDIQPWHGGGPRKRHVGCSNENCRLQPGNCGSTRQRAIDQWNTRDGYVQSPC